MSVIARDSFKFNKRGQFFVRPHNETLPVVAMRVSNPDCSGRNLPGLAISADNPRSLALVRNLI
jgi:hypothetical protein